MIAIHTDMETPERENGLACWWYATPPDHCAFFRHRTFESSWRADRMPWRMRIRVA